MSGRLFRMDESGHGRCGDGVCDRRFSFGDYPCFDRTRARPYRFCKGAGYARRNDEVFLFFFLGRKRENALFFRLSLCGGSDADNSPPRRKYEKAGRALHRRGTYIRGDLLACFARRGVSREVGIGKRRFFVLGRRALCRLSLFLKSSALPLRKRADGYGGAAIDRERGSCG